MARRGVLNRRLYCPVHIAQWLWLMYQLQVFGNSAGQIRLLYCSFCLDDYIR